MTLTANWTYPTAMRFGAGRISELAQCCVQACIARPLLVTDRGLATMAITTQALDVLDGAGLGRALFSEVDPNPTGTNVEQGVAAYREGGHDGVIAFGGGSALDLGKMVAFMAGQSLSIWEFEDIDDWWTRANATAIAPIVAVPTTAGTGSEVGRASVITDTDTHTKKIIFHPNIMPAIVIADPELTVGLPPRLTAGTGMDVFAHCLEAYCSPHFHPMSQGIALEGMRIVKEYLPRAYRDGTDIEARAQMLAGSAMGSTAFQKGLGAIHAISHPVGALFNTHHGTTNAAVMAAVLRFNRSAVEERLAAAARYLNVGDSFDDFYRYAGELRDSLGIANGLASLGVTEDRIDELAAMAALDPSCGGNPIALDEGNLSSLIRDAM